MPVVTRYPSTDAAVSGTWTTPTNVQADDGAVAAVTINAKNTTNDREQGGFGFDAQIPVGSIINQVDIEVEHRVTTGAGIANLENLGYISTTAGAVNSDTLEPTTLTARAYTNYARPGGGSWTRADLLDGTFKTRTRARSGNNATSVTYEWDYIRVKVTYTDPVSGSVSQTDGADSSSASGTVTVTGSLARTNANDSMSASGTVEAGAITGSMAVTEADDTSSASGVVTVSGSLARSNGNDTSTASGLVTVTGTLSRTDGQDTPAIAGLVSVIGTLSQTESDDAMAASGTVTASGVSGTVAVTEDSDVMAAAGTAGTVVDEVAPRYGGSGRYRDELYDLVRNQWELLELKKRREKLPIAEALKERLQAPPQADEPIVSIRRYVPVVRPAHAPFIFLRAPAESVTTVIPSVEAEYRKRVSEADQKRRRRRNRQAAQMIVLLS